MDEKGLQLGGGCKHSDKYYHMSNIKSSSFYQICSDNLELVTVIKCVSPSGLSVPPMFVLAKGSIPEIDDSEMDTPISGITTLPNGWTSNEIGLQWFKETFIPFATAHKVTDDPILCLVNGHDSHETDELWKLTYEFNIIVLAFPSKCTHKLQPLDVLVFSQVQC
jgi:DDE superfamily endonuclease